MNWQKDGYRISTDQSLIDIAVVHNYLSNDSYWANNIPIDTVKRSITHSLCFGVYDNIGQQVGFARVVSDFATFAYLADVFVLQDHRGKGLSKWLMTIIMNHPDLQGLRRFLLTTKDAHSLYARFGFTPYPQPERMMAINRNDIYQADK
ncbi:MAG: GNAT family N-acetyltransferase [Chitinophagaceae bacterium]